MAAVGLIVHQGRPEAADAARRLSRWLTSEGHEVRMPPKEAASARCEHLRASQDAFCDGLDAVVSLGGDGSILRAFELIGTSGVPVLGVDFGRLGYLSEVRPQEARAAILRVLDGDFDIEKRMLLAVDVVREGSGAESAGEACADVNTAQSHVALNEAFIERGPDSNTIRLEVHVDDEVFTTYSADGLIVATPTGSTAYAFSARGPIIDPTHSALLLTPVSPHMLFDRSLVMSPGTRLRIVVAGHSTAVLSVDGRRVARLVEGDAVECSSSPHAACFVTFGDRRFHRVLKAKFGLNGPLIP